MRKLLKHIIRGIIIEHLFILRNRARRAITDILFNYPKTHTPPLHSSGNILFVRLDGKYGDSIISQFLYSEIKSKLGLKIYMLSKNRESIEFFSEEIDQYIICHNTRRLIHLFNAYRKIKDIYFDHVVYLGKQIKDRELILLKHIRTANLITGDKRIRFADSILLNDTPIHYQERCHNLLRILDIKHEDSQPEKTVIHIPEIESNKIIALLNSQENIIYFNPYGSGSQRRLSSQRASEIHSIISEILPKHILITQSETQSELSISKENQNSLTFKTRTFNDILSLISLCKLVITVDTATSHAATALDKNSIVFYNPNNTNYIEWNANSDKSTAIFSNKRHNKTISIDDFENNDLSNALLAYKKEHTQ